MCDEARVPDLLLRCAHRRTARSGGLPSRPSDAASAGSLGGAPSGMDALPRLPPMPWHRPQAEAPRATP
eukprot:3711259-Prymnesium_polylepis.1